MIVSKAAPLTLASLWLLPLAAPAAEKRADRLVLGKYVPDNVYLYVAMAPKIPEREFLNAHWAEVWEAVVQSGVGTEFKNLVVSGMNESERASFEEGWGTISKIFHSVRWNDLIHHEIAFGERRSGLVPDIMFLCRPAEETLAENVKGLASIMTTLAGLDEKLHIVESTIDGVRVWALEIPDAPIGFYLIHRQDVVGIIMGRDAVHDVIALMTGKPDKQPIVKSARYRQALEQIQPPQFSVTFVDLVRMFEFLSQMPDLMLCGKQAPKNSDLQAVSNVLRAAIDHFDFFDYAVATGSMDGLKEYYHSCTKLRPVYTTKPIGRMLTQRKQFDPFDTYLPLDAKGFSISGGIDFEVLYDVILDIVKTQIPDGEALCSQWDTLQEEIGFNLRDDLLGWISGEVVSVTLPAAIQTPFGGNDTVILLGVKDPKKAADKVNSAIDQLNTFLISRDQPSLIMMPTENIPLEGFRSITHPMVFMWGLKFYVGVWDNWLVISTSEASVTKVVNTAQGKAKSIVHNPRFEAEGLNPKGPVCSASFSDLSMLGQELGALFFAMGFAGGVMPNEPETQPIKAVLNSLMKLGPAVAQIDFYSSTSSTTAFKDNAWWNTRVTTYKPYVPEPEPPVTGESSTGAGTATEETRDTKPETTLPSIPLLLPL
jgi:hypothetical protein